MGLAADSPARRHRGGPGDAPGSRQALCSGVRPSELPARPAPSSHTANGKLPPELKCTPGGPSSRQWEESALNAASPGWIRAAHQSPSTMCALNAEPGVAPSTVGVLPHSPSENNLKHTLTQTQTQGALGIGVLPSGAKAAPRDSGTHKDPAPQPGYPILFSCLGPRPALLRAYSWQAQGSIRMPAIKALAKEVPNAPRLQPNSKYFYLVWGTGGDAQGLLLETVPSG